MIRFETNRLYGLYEQTNDFVSDRFDYYQDVGVRWLTSQLDVHGGVLNAVVTLEVSSSFVLIPLAFNTCLCDV